MHFGATTSATKVLCWAAAVTAIQAATRLIHTTNTTYVTLGAAAITAAALTITYRDRTLIGWIRHRASSTRRTPRLAQIISHDNTAILWDHTRTRASIIIEITPKPFTVHLLDQDNTWSSPTLDLDPIRRELRQFDITLHDLTLTTAGYTYARQDRLARIAFTTTGPVSAVAYGRTYLRVTISMADSMPSIAAREIDSFSDPREVFASGLTRTIKIAAARAHRAITLQGFNAKRLSRQDVMALHLDLVELLSDSVGHEGFRHAGNGAPYLVGFSPTKDATAKTHSDWLRGTTEVCATITHITPSTEEADHIEQLYCNKVARLDTVALAEVSQLRREYSQHAAIATTALPLAVPPELTAIPGRTVAINESAATRFMPGGVGIYLGHTLSGGQRIWLDLATACAEPLWLIGNIDIVRLVLIRAAPLGLRIEVRSPELAAIASVLGNAGVGAHSTPDLTITTVGATHQRSATPPQNGAGQSPAPVRIVWSPTPIRQQPSYVIDALEPETLHIHTPTTDVIKAHWEFNPAESALLAESQRT
ncbi:hypothetical protein [Mycobacterium sp. MUNTM1]